MDYRLALFTGIDIPIEECQLIAHQPTITEISYIGEQDFFTGVQCLCLYKSMFVEDKTVLSEINNFQIFMMIMQDEKTKAKKTCVKQVLQLVFPNYKVLFTPNSLLFQGQDSETIIVDIENFEILQEYLRKIFCMSNAPMDQRSFNPSGDKASEIAKKLMRGRDRIAKEKGESNISIFSQYASSLAVGLQMPLKDLMCLTMFQLYDLMERYGLWVAWDQDVRVRLAGGKPDKQPDNWMKNIH